MNKISARELEEIKKDYEVFKSENNSVFKASFLAARKHNFIELIPENLSKIPSDKKNIIALIRENDLCILVIQIIEIEKPIVEKIQTALFYNEL
jgi:hypothetical protein